MKIGITTGSPENNYALFLINTFSKSIANFEFVVISTENEGLSNNLRRIGLIKIYRFLKSKFSFDYMENKVHREFGFTRSLYSYCKKKGIEYICINSFNSTESIKEIKDIGLSYVINCGGGIFKRGFLDLPKYGVINVHMGKLPEVRGMNALEWSLLKKIPLKVTMHYIDTGIDTGPIIEWADLEVNKGDKLSLVRSKSNIVNVELLLRVFRKADKYGHPIPATPQKIIEGRQHYIIHSSLRALVEKQLRQ